MVERMPPGRAAPMSSRLWWLIVMRGMAALLFGLVAVFWPGISLALLVVIFGAYALIDGAITLLYALRQPAGQARRGFLLLNGGSAVAIGLISVLWPDATIVLLLYLVAAWALIFGIIEIAGSLRLKREFGPDWPLSKGGILLVAFALLLLIFPGAVAVVTTWIIGVIALLVGIAVLAFAWRQHQRDRMIID
ncbi:DUF308 domain-containing protein [Ferrovibrio sp.]|uniref:HdeD family acid-resistance protein n=1 Tax=Ferrovibrio sp. TaxID=1917215 RepID=UPI00311F0975